MNKYVWGGLAALLISPVIFEVPVLWRWAEVKASNIFLTDNKADNFIQNSGIEVWGLRNCIYSTALKKKLEYWGFSYTYHDIVSWQQSKSTAPEMWEIVKRANPSQRWTLPVVSVNGTPVVGYGPNIEKVAKVLADQGQLPLKYIPIRAGTRMLFILVIEGAFLLSMNWSYMILGVSSKSSRKRIS